MNETRQTAIDRALRVYDSGAFFSDLQRRVGFRTESQNPAQADALHSYLKDEMTASLAALGFTSQIVDNPATARAPFLVASRIEDPALPTVLTYGHGDVVRGYDDQWREGLTPWALTVEGDRWYGRGTADNKGQHSVNFAALAAVLERDGRWQDARSPPPPQQPLRVIDGGLAKPARPM